MQDGSLQAKQHYLEKEAGNIDCILLRGCYSKYFQLADLYKTYNPEGKIYLSLDANAEWMDTIQWTEQTFYHFMDQCDVISASGRTMQRHLNEKWKWPIEYIPNGFYNFSKHKWQVDFAQKKDRILTVGRLGTPQKATHVLLEAFAKIADAAPSWELRLVGGQANGFEEYLQQFWNRFPQLKNRIHFLGQISEKEALYDEYLQAKIFALPSTVEGAPNVIAEALFAGNAIAITDIDEWKDATNNGTCGLVSKIGDTGGFAQNLLHLCQAPNLEAIGRNAYEYAQANFNMEKITAKLYQLIFCGDL